MNIVERRYSLWQMQKGLDENTKKELSEMENQPKKKEDAFYKDLKFGTSGVRGIMGAGTNRINTPVIHRLTQSISCYLLSKNKKPKVAICYDTRVNSEKYSKEISRVFAMNEITSYTANEPMPLSLLSYSIREMKLDFGIMITASHNSKEYNGYKVYDRTGKQILSNDVREIEKYIDKVDLFDVENENREAPKGIESYQKELPVEMYSKYCKAIIDECSRFDSIDDQKQIKVVYSPLCGTGKKIIPELLKKSGFDNVYNVPNQENWDGQFETCPRPNPENEQAYEEAKKIAASTDADIIICTDPDADRIGLAVKDINEYKILNGNEIATLLFMHVLQKRSDNKTLTQNPVAVRTIATTPIIDEIVEAKGGESKSTLIGFKYIGDVQNQMETSGKIEDFVIGVEESNSYLLSTYVRDKDAITTAIVITMMASYYKSQNQTLLDILNKAYEKYGYYKEKSLSFKLEGRQGERVQNELLNDLRKSYLKLDFGSKLCSFVDYEKKTTKLVHGTTEKSYPKSRKLISLPPAAILEFLLEEGKVVIRPSGTEPKLKVYLFSKSDTEEKSLKYLSDIEEKTMEIIETIIAKIKKSMKNKEYREYRDDQIIEEERREAEKLREQRKRDREQNNTKW